MPNPGLKPKKTSVRAQNGKFPLFGGPPWGPSSYLVLQYAGVVDLVVRIVSSLWCGCCVNPQHFNLQQLLEILLEFQDAAAD